MKQLSALAQKCFDKLNSISHICSIETAALAMSEDQSLSHSLRNAYYEVWEFAKSDY